MSVVRDLMMHLNERGHSRVARYVKDVEVEHPHSMVPCPLLVALRASA